MMRRGGGRGRDRHGREYSPRSEERGGQVGSGRINAPPSRRLWIGNLSIHMTQALLYDTFVRFGDIGNIVFIQGRSYAFVNYRNEEDAIVANRMLQGFVVSGLPLRVEFQKGDKSSANLDADYAQNREERRSTNRGESFEQRDSRLYSPENSHGIRVTEPNEVLQIGFPAFLNINEMMLRRAFSPFGDIDKIIAFPGRTYAFVGYRSVVAACRAKEALQGKLFGNPRVTICFARNHMPPSEHGRDFSTRSMRSSDRIGDTAKLDGKFGMPSSRTFSDMGHMPRGDDSIIGFGQNNITDSDVIPGANAGDAFEIKRFQGIGSEDPYDHRYRNSPLLVDRGLVWHDLPLVERRRRDPNFEDFWDVENDTFPLAKRIRTDSDRYPDKELPEHSFSDFEREKIYSSTPKFHSDREINGRGFESSMSSDRGLHDQPKSSIHQSENDDFWRDDATVGLGPVYLNPTKLQTYNPNSHQALMKEWKWGGTIAKSGTQVCRARCFPVGKTLDFILPDYLDCTARTGLDMLSKHFYQADSSWVVFFVPETDADIIYYNEFMNYLGERKRVAVCKLGEKTTLFLIPPSDFSERILKVPGKVSISGVVLKFLQPTLNFNALPSRPLESNTNAQSYANFQDDPPSQMNHALPDYDRSFKAQNYFNPSSEHINSGTTTGVLPHPMERIPSSMYEDQYDHQLQHQNPNQQSNWHSHENMHIPNANNVGSSRTFDNPMRGEQEYPLLKSITMQQGASLTTHSISGNSDNMPYQHEIIKPQQVPSSTSVHALQPEQLAQLKTLLEHQKRFGKGPVLEMTTTTEPRLLAGDPSGSRLQQMKQYPSNISTATNPAVNNHEHNGRCSQQVESHDGEEEDTEGDPQKRLQATLQLAAALLQQIQHKSN